MGRCSLEKRSFNRSNSADEGDAVTEIWQRQNVSCVEKRDVETDSIEI